MRLCRGRKSTRGSPPMPAACVPSARRPSAKAWNFSGDSQTSTTRKPSSTNHGTWSVALPVDAPAHLVVLLGRDPSRPEQAEQFVFWIGSSNPLLSRRVSAREDQIALLRDAGLRVTAP